MLLSFIGNGYVWQEGDAGVATVTRTSNMSSRPVISSLDSTMDSHLSSGPGIYPQMGYSVMIINAIYENYNVHYF